MRYATPTVDELAEWQTWLAERPANVRVVAERFDPWTLYRMKSTKRRVVIVAFDEGANDGKVTLKVGVYGEFNFVVMERVVFGVDPDDLEECAIPGIHEPCGSMDIDVSVIREMIRE